MVTGEEGSGSSMKNSLKNGLAIGVAVLLLTGGCRLAWGEPQTDTPAAPIRPIPLALDRQQDEMPDREHWQEEYNLTDRLRVVADAPVVSLDRPICSVSLAPVDLDDEMVSAFPVLISEDARIYEALRLTRGEILGRVMEARRTLAVQKSADGQAELVKRLKNYREEFASAPEYGVLRETTPDFRTDSEQPGVRRMEAYAIIHGRGFAYTASVSERGVGRLSLLPQEEAGVCAGYAPADQESASGLKLSGDDALRQAEQINRRLKSGLTAAWVHAVERVDHGATAWCVEYTRKVRGAQVGCVGSEIGEAEELLRIYVDDGGFTGLEWNAPMEETGVLDENVMTLPLEEIEKIVKLNLGRTLEQTKAAFGTGRVTCSIGLLRQSLMCLPDDGVEGGYRLEPVWDVYLKTGAESLLKGGDGTEAEFLGARSSLTLSAVDGRVIRRGTAQAGDAV